jgi:hypothetical protein
MYLAIKFHFIFISFSFHFISRFKANQISRLNALLYVMKSHAAWLHILMLRQLFRLLSRMPPVAKKFDYLVIGGGSGGIASARRATEFGVSVAVIEHGRLGGTCVGIDINRENFDITLRRTPVSL